MSLVIFVVTKDSAIFASVGVSETGLILSANGAGVTFRMHEHHYGFFHCDGTGHSISNELIIMQINLLNSNTNSLRKWLSRLSNLDPLCTRIRVSGLEVDVCNLLMMRGLEKAWKEAKEKSLGKLREATEVFSCQLLRVATLSNLLSSFASCQGRLTEHKGAKVEKASG